jgi:hypothetical protein
MAERSSSCLVKCFLVEKYTKIILGVPTAIDLQRHGLRLVPREEYTDHHHLMDGELWHNYRGSKNITELLDIIFDIIKSSRKKSAKY